MDNKIKTALNHAYGLMIPNNMYSRIEQNIDRTQERTMIIPMKKKFNNKIFKNVLSVAAALVLVVVGAFGGVYYSNNLAVDSIIDIDINPSVEITANKQDRVIDALAINEDAKVILKDMDLKGTDLDVAVNAILGSMLKNGYLKKDIDGEILVTVKNDNEEKATNVKTKILNNIEEVLKAEHISATVINQSASSETKDAEEFAKKHNISIGKAQFILNLCKKDSSLNPDELANKSIIEISKIVKDKKIDISDIVDYDYSDSVGENIAEDIEDKNEEAPLASIKGKISKEDARRIALEDAKLSKSDVKFTKAELDLDDGVLFYDIEFRANGKEYDYEIEAYKGKVISKDVDIDEKPVVNSAPSVSSSESETASSKPDSNSYIGKNKAKQNAAKHAGVKYSNARFERVEFSLDDGVAHYEVDFYADGVEYDYEVDAISGAILKSESEGKKQSSEEPKKEISREKAKSLALKHADVNEKDAFAISIEKDRDDGRVLYEIEFKAGGYEYSCNVDAYSGKISDFEKEFDD